MKEEKLVPDNVKGKATDLDYAVTAASDEEAADCFTRAWKRMMNPPIWHKLCGSLSANFVLTGEHGDPVDRLAQQNDHIRIDIPGPGNRTGDGHDWVLIESIEQRLNPAAAEEYVGMKVHASANPKGGNDTAHFFGEDATSTFIITRNGKTVTATYHGRNELPNTSTQSIADNIRNSVVAMGAFVGLSELQWSALIRSFLQEEIGG
jgi:hypothetical protein